MCNNLQGSVFSSWTYQFIENILHKYYVLFLLRSYCSSQVFYYFLKCVINTKISLFLSLKICLVNIKCVFSSKQLRLNSYNFFPFKKKKNSYILPKSSFIFFFISAKISWTKIVANTSILQNQILHNILQKPQNPNYMCKKGC